MADDVGESAWNRMFPPGPKPFTIPVNSDMAELADIYQKRHRANCERAGLRNKLQDTDNTEMKNFIGALGEIVFAKYAHQFGDWSADPHRRHQMDFTIDGETIDVKSCNPKDGNFYLSIQCETIKNEWPAWFVGVKFPFTAGVPPFGTIVGMAPGKMIFAPDHLRPGKTRRDGSKMTDFYCVRFRDLVDCSRFRAAGEWVVRREEIAHLLNTLGWYPLDERHRLVAAFIGGMEIRVIK
jgi:hypothetical protein